MGCPSRGERFSGKGGTNHTLSRRLDRIHRPYSGSAWFPRFTMSICPGLAGEDWAFSSGVKLLTLPYLVQWLFNTVCFGWLA